MNYLNILIETSDIISVSALIVSIIALIIGIRYNRKTYELTKKHNILSNKPVVSTKFIYNYVTGVFEIGIENNGIGPAFIDNIVFTSKKQESNKIKDLVDGLHSSFGGDYNFNSKNQYHMSFSKRYCLSEKSYNMIYKDEILDYTKEELKILYNEIGDFKVKIFYSDIYDNTYERKQKLRS